MNGNLMKDFERMKTDLLKREAEWDFQKERLQGLAIREQEMVEEIKDAEKARVIIQEVAKQTQQKLEYHISHIVTMALKAINPNWPEFKVEIVIKRDNTECNLLFVENDAVNKPIETSGGGALDVASFALRVAFWTLNKNRPTLVLDEPFHYVSPDLQHKVSDMLKLVSEKLGLQIIMVSHADEINYSADKTFYVTKSGSSSKISILD